MKKGIILIITLFCMQFSFAQCELDPKHPWDLMKLNQIISQGGICADAWDCSFPRRLAYLTISAGNLTGNVDLSGCTGLQVLNCANNHITSLNLSGCLLLQSINCSNNWVSNINLNGCNSLQSIVCNYNLITNLDVSNKLLLQGVNCSNNLLTNINISGCNQLLSVFCQNNKLTEFNAYSSATLTNVDCSMNKISNLKFNGCTSLKKLNCKQNKLKNSALTSLYGLKLGQGISNYNLDLRQNIGFTSNAIHKLDSNLQYLNYNQILYDSVSDQFSTELNWYNETNDSITHPYGVATDGSATIKLTVIREQGYSVIDSIRIQLQNYNNTNTDPLGTIAYCSLYNTSSDTIFTFSQTGLNQWEFLYIAPDVFTNTSNSNINKRFVNAVVTIYYTKTGIDSSYTCNQKIELIRPPVLFIHGFNEGLSTFSTIQNDLILSGRYFNKQHVFCADYSASNTASFITNTEKGIISSEIEKSKEALIKIGYKVKKIDIVGHSMGGNLIRLYLQSDDYKFDIHKLITLNTPHSGTQLANEAFDLLLNHPYLNGLIYMLIPAVDDFKVTSYATRNILNGIDYLNSNIVPSHAITSKIIINETVKQIIKKDKLANLTYILFKFKNPILSSFMMNVVDSMPIKITQYLAQLYNDSNDMVVSINSQKGGLFNSATTTINQESHNGTLKNIYVISRIKELLELPSSSNSFSMDGFHPPILNWPNTPAPVINQNKSMLLANTNDSIRLISPIAGTTVANGQNININIMGTSGVKNILLTILESQDSVVLIDTLTSSFNYNYTVPQTACGKINIMAIGLDTLGNIFIDSSFINVQPNATASSIIIDYPEDSLVLSQGLLGSIYVNCLFSDSIIREITTLPNVIYSLKNNNAAYISQGVFKGIHPGNDTIMVSYSGLTAKMPVHIGNYYSPTDSIKLYDTICQGNTYNFYGNILNNTGIYDTTFVNQYGGDSIIILNLTVNPLPATAGTISGLSTVCQGQSSVTYKVLTIANATSYTWTLPTGANGISSTDTIVINYGTSAVSGNIIVRGNNSCGIGDSSLLSITVNPLPLAAGTISGLTTVCQGQTSVVYKVPAIANATSYTWTLPSGATGTSSVDSIVVSYGSSAISGNITVKGHNTCGSGTVSTKAITVNLLPATAGIISGLATVCQGLSSVVYKVPTISNATSYIWTLPSGATGTSNVDSIVVSYGASATSGNITVKGNNTCGSGTVSTKAITVNPLPATAGIISGLATVCQGLSSVVYKVPTISNATSYTWTLPSGATGTNSVDSIVVSFGTSAVSGNITVKGNNSCGSGTVSTKAIIVNPLPANTGTITGLATVCQGQSSVTYKVSTIANATSYTWTLPSGATGTSSVDSIVVNYGTSAVSGNITVKGNNACGSGTVSTKAIIVNPLPANTGTITGLATVCQGQSNVIYKVPTIANATSYTWTLPSGATGTSNLDSIIVNFGTSATSGSIKVKGNNACGNGGLSSKLVTVTQLPVINDTSITICNSSRFMFIPVNSQTGITYSWTASASSPLVTGYSATGNNLNFISDSVINSTNTNQTITYNVTPFNGNCAGSAFALHLIIKPSPSVLTIPQITTCNGEIIPTIHFASNMVGTTYSWTNSNPAIGLAASGNDSISMFTAINNGLSMITATITVIPQLGNCSGTPKTFTISIEASPVINPSTKSLSAYAYCNGKITNPITFSGNSLFYTWTNNNSGIGLASSGLGNIPSFTAINNTANPVNATIIVTPHSQTCIGLSDTIHFTINPSSSMPSVVSNITLCQYQLPILLTANGTDLLWYTSMANGNGDSIAPTLSTLNHGTTIYYVTQNTNGCESNKNSITVNILPKPATPIITQNGDSLISDVIIGNQWYSLINGIINNATSAFYLPQQIGDYFTIVTLNGCSSDTSNILHFDNTGINNLFGSDCKILVSPNPFSINTTISYTLTENKYIRLSITDITGREIEILHEGYQAKGEYKYVFTPKSTANGIYFYKLQIDNKYVSGKLIYAK